MNDLEVLRGFIRFVAMGFNGEKELPENGGFVHPWMTKIMTACGFVKGYSWCMITVEAIFRLAIGKLRKERGELFLTLWNEATSLINPSTQQTYNNFVAHGKLFKVLPVNEATYSKLNIGDIVIFVKPAAAAYGHAGVIVDVKTDYFMTIEGNTNKAGGANGDGVYIKRRTIEHDKKGLDVRGFIQLTAVE